MREPRRIFMVVDGPNDGPTCQGHCPVVETTGLEDGFLRFTRSVQEPFPLIARPEHRAAFYQLVEMFARTSVRVDFSDEVALGIMPGDLVLLVWRTAEQRWDGRLVEGHAAHATRGDRALPITAPLPVIVLGSDGT